MEWPGVLCFPPFSVITQALGKIERGKATGVVVVPHWPAQVRARMHGKGFCYPAGKRYPGGSYCGGWRIWFGSLLTRLLRRDPVPLTVPRPLSLLAEPDTDWENNPPPTLRLMACAVSDNRGYLQAGFSRPKHQITYPASGGPTELESF